MKKIGNAIIITDTIIPFPKGMVVEIAMYEAGDESESVDCLTEDDFNQGHCSYTATIYGGIGGRSNYSVDVDEWEFELIKKK